MIDKLSTLKKEHPKTTFHREEVFFSDGEQLATRKYVAKDMGVSEKTVSNWEKQGLEPSTYSTKRFKLYDIKELRKWHKLNVDQKFNAGADKNKTDDEMSDLEKVMNYKVGDEITPLNAKIAREVSEAHIKAGDQELIEMKVKEARGEYIKADDVDKITTEMVVVLLSAWRNLLEILPPLLTNKKQHEVRNILDDEFEAEVEVLNRKINA